MISRRSLLALGAALPALSFSSLALADQSQPSITPAGTWPLVFTDLAGRKVSVAKRPERIIVGNYIQNFMLVGGKASLERVVGMTQDHWETARVGEYKVFTSAYPELNSIASIGGYHDDILNSERILSLKPDVLLINRTQYNANSARVELFERSGIRVIVIDYHAMKLENHMLSTLIIGRILGADAVAEALCQKAAAGLKAVFNRVAAAPQAEKKRRVYVELGNRGVGQYGNSYNSTILWGAMLESIGAKNIAAANKEPWGALTREFVISQQPEIIIIGGSIWAGGAADQMQMGFTVTRENAIARLKAFASRPLWQSLPAVKNGRLYAVDHGSLRTIIDWHMTAFLAKVCYPAAFADIDPEAAMVADYQERLPELDPTGTFTLALRA